MFSDVHRKQKPYYSEIRLFILIRSVSGVWGASWIFEKKIRLNKPLLILSVLSKDQSVRGKGFGWYFLKDEPITQVPFRLFPLFRFE